MPVSLKHMPLRSKDSFSYCPLEKCTLSQFNKMEFYWLLISCSCRHIILKDSQCCNVVSPLLHPGLYLPPCSTEYRVGKSKFTVVSTQNTYFILALLFMNYCIIYLYYNYKPAFAHPCMFIILKSLAHHI